MESKVGEDLKMAGAIKLLDFLSDMLAMSSERLEVYHRL
jgi:hypothetical protein